MLCERSQLIGWFLPVIVVIVVASLIVIQINSWHREKKKGNFGWHHSQYYELSDKSKNFKYQEQ